VATTRILRGSARRPSKRVRPRAGAPRPRGSILRNARHERFAQELAQGKSATDAYRAAGYTGDRRAAANLWTNVDIRARVAELKSGAAERVGITMLRLIAEAADLQQRALAAGAYGAALGAVVVKGKLAGLLPKPPEPEAPGVELSRLSNAERKILERAEAILSGQGDPEAAREADHGARQRLMKKIAAIADRHDRLSTLEALNPDMADEEVIRSLKEKIANLERQIEVLDKMNRDLEALANLEEAVT
jgi:hypothetical protein